MTEKLSRPSWFVMTFTLITLGLGVVASVWPITSQSSLVWTGEEFYTAYILLTPMLAALLLLAISQFLKDQINPDDGIGFSIVLGCVIVGIFLAFWGTTTLDVVRSVNPTIGSLMLGSVVMGIASVCVAANPQLNNAERIESAIVAALTLIIQWGLTEFSPTADKGWDWLCWIGSPVRFVSTFALGWLVFLVVGTLGGDREGRTYRNRLALTLAGLGAILMVGILGWYRGDRFERDLFVAIRLNKLENAMHEPFAERIQILRRLRDEVKECLHDANGLHDKIDVAIVDSWMARIAAVLETNDVYQVYSAELLIESAAKDVKPQIVEAESQKVLSVYRDILNAAAKEKRIADTVIVLEKVNALAGKFKLGTIQVQREGDYAKLKRQWYKNEVRSLPPFQDTDFSDEQVELLWRKMLQSHKERSTILLAYMDGRFLVATEGKVELADIPD